MFKRDRESVLQEQLLFVRSGFGSSDQDLASIGTSSETVALEVVSSTLCVDIVKGEPMSWFASVFSTPTIGSVFETDTR